MPHDGREQERQLRFLRVLWCEIAALAVILTGDVSFWLSGLILVLIPALGLAADNSPWLKPARSLTSILAIFYLFFFPLDWLVLSDQLVFAVVHLIFYLKIHMLLHVRTEPERYRYRLYVLCLFEMLAAASMTVSMSFLFPFVLFVLVGALVLIFEQACRARGKSSSRNMLEPAVRTALMLGLVVLVTAGLIFVILPRSALGGFRVGGVKGITITGLADEIQLGDFGEIKLSQDVVMRVVAGEGELVFPPKWRGAAYDRYEDGRWSQSRSVMVLLPQRGPGRFLLDRPSTEPRVSNEVFLEPLDTDVLFIPPASLELFVSLPNVLADPYLTVRSGRRARAGRRYKVSWRHRASASTSSLGGVERLRGRSRRQYLQLPDLSEEFHELARRFVTGREAELEVAREIESFLKEELSYSLVTPSRRRQDPVEDFLFDARAGHCEFFATAMVMMLRSGNIPSRLVTGFQGGELNELADFEVVRKSNAHAWVEVYDEQLGWVAFDPTPPAPFSSQTRTFDIFYKGIGSLRLFWEIYVVAFDHVRQQDVWAAFGSGLGAFASAGREALTFVRENARALAVIGLLLVVGWILSRSRLGRIWQVKLRVPWLFRRGRLRDRPESAIRFYENLLRRLERWGFSKPAGMTPAEFAESLEDRLPGVSELTHMYYRVRYGGEHLGPEAEIRVERLVTAVQVTALSMADITGRSGK
jgi:transglutaminase-like putative cysteine protease